MTSINQNMNMQDSIVAESVAESFIRRQRQQANNVDLSVLS
jgi:hypothetical protein